MGIRDWFRERFSTEDEIPEPMRHCDSCGFEFPETSLVILSDSLYCNECHTKKRKEAEEEE